MSREAFVLPEAECRRLTRNEMISIRMNLALVSEMTYAKDDLKRILAVVPDGQERMDGMLQTAQELFEDVVGTVGDKQRRSLRNTAKDYNIQLKPKACGKGDSIMISISEVENLVDMAQEKCAICAEDGVGCRKCPLYQWLEVNAPLNDYGDGLMCPYACATITRNSEEAS